MSAKVIFHLPERFVHDYHKRGHLGLYAKIKQVIEARGGTVQAVVRDQRLRNPGAPVGLVNKTDLHIIENGWVQQPNALNATIAYIPPFWHLDPQGVLYNSGISAKTYDQKAVNFRDAMVFFKSMRQKYVHKRKSRYNQKTGRETLPAGAIAVFLQGGLPEEQGVAHCSTEEMLRVVAANAAGRPVIVKAHPNSNQIADANLVRRLMADGLELIPTDANIHDILKDCAITVSFNSAVSIEGFLHRKPAILFGKSDFHHFAETVTNPADFSASLARALAREGGYAQFVYWYFHENGLSLDDPEFAQTLLGKFAALGFTAQKLGLNSPANWQDAAAVALELAELLQKKAEITSCKIVETLKLSDTSQVFAAKVNGKKVVVKRFVTPDAAQTILNMQKELDHLGTTMNQGANQVNRCLYAFPQEGVVVLSMAQGPRLSDAISAANPAKRSTLLQHSGAWLAAYTQSRRRQTTFGAGYWVNTLRKINLTPVTDPQDIDLLQKLLTDLHRRASETKGCSVFQAATHGDFVGINAHYADGVICGVDIQGECWLAIAKEAARFLVWIRIHEADKPREQICGIARTDWQAFLASGVLDAQEQKTTLPFFIGTNLYSRFVAEYRRADIRTNTRQAIQDFLTTPELPPRG